MKKTKRNLQARIDELESLLNHLDGMTESLVLQAVICKVSQRIDFLRSLINDCQTIIDLDKTVF